MKTNYVVNRGSNINHTHDPVDKQKVEDLLYKLFEEGEAIRLFMAFNSTNAINKDMAFQILEIIEQTSDIGDIDEVEYLKKELIIFLTDKELHKKIAEIMPETSEGLKPVKNLELDETEVLSVLYPPTMDDSRLDKIKKKLDGMTFNGERLSYQGIITALGSYKYIEKIGDKAFRECDFKNAIYYYKKGIEYLGYESDGNTKDTRLFVARNRYNLGKSYAAIGNFSSAEQELHCAQQEFMNLLELENDDRFYNEQLINIYLELAEVYRKTSRTKQSKQYYNKVKDMLKDSLSDTSLKCGLVNIGLGLLERDSGETVKASVQLDDAKSAIHSSERVSPAIQIKLLCALAEIQVELNDLDNAENNFKLALDLAERNSENYLKGFALNGLGWAFKKKARSLQFKNGAHNYKDFLIKSIDFHELAICTFNRFNNNYGLAFAWHAKGKTYFELKELKKASFCQKKALDYTKLSNFKRGEGYARLAITRLEEDHIFLGDDSLVVSENQNNIIQSYEEIIEIFVEVGDKKGLARVNIRLGHIYRNLALTYKALTCYKEALRLYTEISDDQGQAAALNGIGFIKRYQGDLESAKVNHYKALNIYKKNHDQKGVATIYVQLGLIGLKQNEFDLATQRFTSANEIMTKASNVKGIAWVLRGKAKLYMEQNKFGLAIELASQAAVVFEVEGEYRGSAWAKRTLAEIYLREGNVNLIEANKVLTSAIKLFKLVSDRRGLGYSYISLARWAILDSQYQHDMPTPNQLAIDSLEKARQYINEVNDIIGISQINKIYDYINKKSPKQIS